jgi:hypothetical protein
MVPLAGLEPARSCPRGILSPLCLPIPPQRLKLSDRLALDNNTLKLAKCQEI